MTFLISNAKLINKGALIGSFDVELPSGLIIRSCTLFEKAGSHWISFPAREYQKQDASKGYFQFIAFRDPATSDKFKDAVMPFVLAAFKSLEPPPEPARRAGQSTANLIDDDICF
jgi:hypothetical protein